MNRNDYNHANAEISFLESMAKRPGLSKLSARSIEARLARARMIADDFDANAFMPARAVLTYRGAPVRGTLGVVAEFGSSATRAFSEAVSAVAASLMGALADKGPIPNKPNNQLLITGTALGSFGFVLEESPGNNQLQLEGTTAVAQALDLIVELLEASTQSDEELSESVSKLANRAITSVTDFLAQLADNGASCALTAGAKQFRFASVEQVKASKARLSLDNIKERDEEYVGCFLGALPERRSFEFLTEDGHVIHGSITKDVENPAIINHHLNKRVKITTHTRVVGRSKPRYTLSALPWQ